MHNSIQDMSEMLTYRRPHRSKTERKFIQRFITPLGVIHDKYGNRYKRIGEAPIMYSCHTDTVHRDGGIQDIAVNKATFKLSRKSKSNCLGADNGAGVWLMREMILAEKPGLYVFHRGEECGGLGSKFLTKNTPELVKDIQAAIAFDRRNTKSIITRQFGGRCCSDEFADSLAEQLKLGHKKDTGGSFTDTANYTDLIPECTNVSVGYDHEHSWLETLDMNYLIELRQSMLEYDWEKLVIKRKAGEKETYTYKDYRKGWDWWAKDENETWSEYYNKKRGKGSYDYDKGSNVLTYTPPEHRKPVGFLSDETILDRQGDLLPDGHELGDESLAEYTKSEKSPEDRSMMIRMIKNNPLLIANFLEDYGIGVDEVADFLHQAGGLVPWQMYGASK